MTPAQLEALARIRGAAHWLDSDELLRTNRTPAREAHTLVRVTDWCRIITEAAAELTTETVRAQLSASLATGEK